MKRVKLLLLALALVFVSVAAFGCAKKDAENTFTLGFDADFPPYGYIDEKGDYIGFDLDLAAEVCSRRGWELKLSPIDWNSKDFELESGAIDCIWNGFTMNGRESLYTWTDPYMDNSQVFVTRAADNLTTFADLAGKTVTVQMDSSCEAALNDEENPEAIALRDSFASLERCAEYNTAFMELESGAVDAIGMDIGVARFQIEGREDQFIIMAEPLQSEQYGIGFKLGNTELRDQVQETLMEMVSDGTFAKISNEWFGYDVCILGE